MARSLSLLERLGGKPQEKKSVQTVKPQVQPEIKKVVEPEITPTYTQKQSQEVAEQSAPEASAFAGRYTNVSKADVLQELKLAVHRRIVD